MVRRIRGGSVLIFSACLLMDLNCFGQIDPERRNLLELGYDQTLVSQGPQALYLYYYYNNPEFVRTNLALRMAIAPAYVDGELGIKQAFSPSTDVGIGFYGGLLGDNYYEVDDGSYQKTESFYGSGAGAAISLYQHVNPGQLIPLNIIVRAGFRYSVYSDTRDTADNFVLPPNRYTPFTRVGLRLAGPEPVLYPDLGLEVSVWYERQWRFGTGTYGFNNDLSVAADSSLYWARAGMNYAWTNVGQKVSFTVTAGGTEDADRFSAWRLGGVLPLVSEFPLMLPGYYYQEISAERFVDLYGAYVVSLDAENRWAIRVEGAGALLQYLPGLELPNKWQMGAGAGITYHPTNRRFSIVLRYGYGFNAIRDGERGGQSIGVLFQYDFSPKKKT